MIGGDISAEVPPALLFIVEGLIAFPPDKKRHWRDADRWSVDGRMVANLWDLAWRTPFGHDLVTFTGEKMAQALEERFERDHIPFGQFLYAKGPRELADVLPSTNYHRVVFGEVETHDLFGALGHHVTSPEMFDVSF